MKAEDALTFDSEHRLRAENLCFDIDTWYPRLQAYTFPSVFIPLQVAEGQAILGYNDATWRQKRAELTLEESDILRGLESSINDVIQELIKGHGPSAAAFVRLCGRSPKDGEPLFRDQIIPKYQEELKRLLSQNYPDTANTKMIAIARTPYMKVRSGEEAMSLLLTSERVYADILDWIRFGEPEQVCVRLWEDELTLDNEFRVFVCKGRVTAISQYDHYTYYEHIFQMKDELQRGIYALWKSMHHVVGLETYVLDVAYLPIRKQFVVVELSPFAPCTGPACFHWQADKDILENGNATVSSDSTDSDYDRIVFRLKEESQLHQQLDDLVQLNWECRWAESKVPYNIYYKEAPTPSIWTSMTSMFKRKTSNAFASNSTAAFSALFVYGTLKYGFQWNNKYLNPRLGAVRVSAAITEDRWALVVGDSGVPYLLGDIEDDPNNVEYHGKLHQLKGELWEVGPHALAGLDDYEGISKGYYSRISIPIRMISANGEKSPIQVADVYVLNHSDAELRSKEFIPEYTMEIHREQYKPIQHIQVKQCNYFKTPSTWGKTNDIIDASLVKPKS